MQEVFFLLLLGCFSTTLSGQSLIPVAEASLAPSENLTITAKAASLGARKQWLRRWHVSCWHFGILGTVAAHEKAIAMRNLLIATSALVIAAAAAQAAVVRVEDMAGGDNTNIHATQPGFGSAGSVTLNWDPDNNPSTALLIWRGGYSGRDAAWCGVDSGAVCALEMTVSGSPPALYSVSLESFFLGGWPTTDRNIAYTVTDLDGGAVVASGTPLVSGVTGLVVDVNAISSVGFRISFGPDGYNGGINDITYFEIIGDPIPTPGALALFGFGLAGLSLLRRAR
jgi:hypothetical protein